MNDEFDKAFTEIFGANPHDVIATLEQENRQLRARNERLEKFVAQVELVIEQNRN